jgi:hypothetical protein
MLVLAMQFSKSAGTRATPATGAGGKLGAAAVEQRTQQTEEDRNEPVHQLGVALERALTP